MLFLEIPEKPERYATLEDIDGQPKRKNTAGKQPMKTDITCQANGHNKIPHSARERGMDRAIIGR